jgi:hypothetical protein
MKNHPRFHMARQEIYGMLDSILSISLDYLLVRVGAYISDVIGRGFETVRNSHSFENLIKDRFKNWTPI